MTTTLFLLLLAAAAAVLAGDYLLRRLAWHRMGTRARSQAERIVEEARQTAAHRVREAELSAEEQKARRVREAEESARARQEAAERLDEDLRQRQAGLEQEGAALARRRKELEEQAAGLERRRLGLERRDADVAARETSVAARLEEVAGLSRQEALERLRAEIAAEARARAQEDAARALEEARAGLDARLKEMTARGLQRLRIGGFVESTVSIIRLPSDDMKGRIIGREGRNIRSIEMTTGIDLIVDDTPGTILISSFDPLRREVARVAIERLVEDGRIHPARIEELVEKTRAEMDQLIDETGETAAFELGIQELQPRLVRLLGQLKYHTAQGQNLLQHCRETADLAGALAVELGLPPEVPRRAALLHEIAQAAGERLAAPSILASGEMAVRHGESRAVQQAIAAAHPDVTPRDVDGALVRFACRLSRSRLGARKHNLEVFISRQRRLEALAASLPGVRAAHVFRAGKELRVVVDSEKMSDQEAVALSREITSRIRREVDTPGEIRVSVLRETRAVDFAL